MLDTTCPRCGVTFQQPDDPGRRRVFCSNACRQRDYRARTGKNGHEAQQQRARAEQERREQHARRERERRARERTRQTADAPEWLRRLAGGRDSKEQRAAARALLIYARMVHRNTPAHEADTCRRKLDADCTRYGWPRL